MKSIILSIILLFAGCIPAAPPPNTDTITTGDTATLYFSSFDGGGPEYSVSIDDPSVVAYEIVSDYDKPDHNNMPGAGYNVIYTFTGLKPGDTNMTVSARSPIGGNYDTIYRVTVDEGLNVIITEIKTIPYSGDKPMTATLTFSSFDGGGPEYSIKIDDPSIITYDSSRHYHQPNHEELDGAGYDVIFTFTGLKPGETTMTVTEYSPIMDNFDAVYKITVDDKLNVEITLVNTEDTGY